MARKNVFTNPLALSQTLAASFNSSATIIQWMDNCAYQINVTTSNSQGTFAVQVSNDYSINPLTGVIINAGHWTDLSLGGGTPTVNAANDTIVITLNQLPYTAMRLAYTSTVAGTGLCDIYLTCKEIGG